MALAPVTPQDPPSAVAPTGALGRQRLAGALGVLVLGGYTVGHILGLLPMATGGAEAFNSTLPWRRSLVLLLAVALLWGVPLLVHAVHGLSRLRQVRVTVGRYPGALNWVFALRHWAGVVVLLFVVVHVIEMRLWPWWRGMTVDAGYLQRHFSVFLTVDFYVLGIAATVFHFASGVWSVACRWGVLAGKRAQRLGGYVALAAGGLLLALALWVLAAFHDARFVVM